jgi:diguanylate cyclase (GGDEF)-like protein
MLRMSAENSAPARPTPEQEESARGNKAARRTHAAREPGTYRNLVASLFSSPGSLVSGTLACCIGPLLCWRATHDRPFLILTLFVILVGVLRIGTLIRYRRETHESDDISKTSRWDREYILGATVMSCALGVNGYLALSQTDNFSAHVVAVALNIGLASGYVARNAARPRFALLQIALFLGPTSAGLLLSADPYYNWLSLLLILYIIVNGLIILSAHRDLLALIDAKKTADDLAVQLRRQNLTLDAALNTMSHGVAMFDENLCLCVANERHFTLFGLKKHHESQTLKTMGRELLRAAFISRMQALSLFHSGNASLKDRRTSQLEIVTAKGSSFIVSFYPSSDGRILMVTEDATARRRAEAEIERLARMDALTGLPNRREFGKTLGEAMDALASGGRAFALFYVDLDGFKRINDTLGHECGDALLNEVAKRLIRRKRPLAVVSRLGGDEFAAIHTLENLEKTMAVAAEICTALREPFHIGTSVIRISASVGVALAPTHGGSSEELLRNADIALYRAKAKGRGSIVCYDASMAADVDERLTLEADLQAAVIERAFELHYQPIVDITGEKIVAYEALMRWPHAKRGYVPPSVFIPIAEQTGHIEALGCFAIRRACADAASWAEDVCVCVNVSVLQFRNPKMLVDSVKGALADHGLDPSRLTLEITESVFIDEFEVVVDTIEEIRDLGVRFSLDDFGTGYSSLSLLSRLPFSFVKIDRSLTKDIASNSTSHASVEAVCALAKRIGMEVVVEGVETQEQQSAIQRIGADRMQGWLFGVPEPIRNIVSRRSQAAA